MSWYLTFLNTLQTAYCLISYISPKEVLLVVLHLSFTAVVAIGSGHLHGDETADLVVGLPIDNVRMEGTTRGASTPLPRRLECWSDQLHYGRRHHAAAGR